MQKIFLMTTDLVTAATGCLAQGVSFSSGFAVTVNDGLFDCGCGSHISAVDEVVCSDGVTRSVPAATNFTEVFDTPDADAAFIWSSNLVLDNLVLLRTTIA